MRYEICQENWLFLIVKGLHLFNSVYLRVARNLLTKKPHKNTFLKKHSVATNYEICSLLK
jgi:hypothetical protein